MIGILYCFENFLKAIFQCSNINLDDKPVLSQKTLWDQSNYSKFMFYS
jgi:hypothetical protein